LIKGYPNLFPLFFGHAKPESIAPVLKLINEPHQLKGFAGIRSLSISNSFFGTGDNYWRGSIWVNINYLVSRGVYLHYPEFKPQ
jgi:mannosyl-oligosaccharide glucosidase